jgi:hypothetical protein
MRAFVLLFVRAGEPGKTRHWRFLIDCPLAYGSGRIMLDGPDGQAGVIRDGGVKLRSHATGDTAAGTSV